MKEIRCFGVMAASLAVMFLVIGCAGPAGSGKGGQVVEKGGAAPAPPGSTGFAQGWQTPGQQPGQGGPPLPPNPGAHSEQISFMNQRLAASEDDKKVLQARVRQLEGQLRDKDRALAQASQDIQDTTQQIARTREELQRWKQELLNLRGKLQNVERDNKATLEAIIRTLEQFIDREREVSKTPEGPVLEPMK